MTDNELGQVVRFHREQAGLTQLALAQLAGVGKTTVFDIEKGKRTVQYNSILRVLDVLNISLTWKSPLKEYFPKGER